VRCAKCKHSWFQGQPLPDDAAAGDTSVAREAPASALPRAANSQPSSDAPPGEPIHGMAQQTSESTTSAAPPPVPNKPVLPEDSAAPSVSHWKTDDEQMESIAARALRKGASDRAQPPRVPGDGVSSDTVADGDATSASPAGAPDEVISAENDPVAEPFTSETDPLAGEAGPLESDDDSDDTPFDSDYDDDLRDDEYEEGGVSQFEYRAPFTARRNPAKMWTAAAAIFALMAVGTVLAVNYYGLPGWLPINQPSFGIGKPDLVLDFPSVDQGEETLNEGQTIFRVRGSINNVGRETQTIPNLVVVFEDDQDVEVYRKIIIPTKSELAPGETLKVTEAISDYPANAADAGIGWSPN